MAESISCFAAGTLIRTPIGDVAVETLKIGDSVVTASGPLRPVRRLAHRAIEPRACLDPHAAHPIRICAHTFGPGKPDRDLFVSPDHAIGVTVLDEVLIPAHAMINDATIAQIEVDEVTYWHVELDTHDLLLANGLPAESYIDVGNHAVFGASDGDHDQPRDAATLAEHCRPLVTDEAVLLAVRMQLRGQALALGWSLGGSPLADLHVVADGLVQAPSVDGLAARFLLPANATDVWLVSETSVPTHVGDTTDDRRLGVYLRAVTIDDGLRTRREISLGEPLLCVGFHGVEGLEPNLRRWTAGRARLPTTLWAGCQGRFFLRVDLAGPPLPRWIAPERPLPPSDDRRLRLVGGDD